jgi:hypothetical protein
MALQSKTLLNDLGSAVVAETVSQLNRASGIASLARETLAAGPNNLDGFIAAEDMFVTSVTVMAGGAWIAADTLSAVNDTDADGTGGVVVATVTGLTTAADEAVTLAVNRTIVAGTAFTVRIGVDALSTLATTEAIGSVDYRPVKDSLSLEPSFTQAMSNFKSTAR